MHFLVGWDDPAQTDLISSFLNLDGTSASIFQSSDEFSAAARRQRYDAVLLSLDFPSSECSFGLFQMLRECQSDVPVVGVWRAGEIGHLARFVAHGLHSHLQRDEQGEFVLLLTTMLEAAVASARARRAELVAEKLREEVESVRQLQEAIIPHELPRVTGYGMAARYEPSQIRVLGDRPVVMAGGDYYNAFRLSDRNLALILGDAAGHGVRACMSIMCMHTLITMICDQRYPSSAEFVTEVNHRLANNSIVSGEQGGFITLLFAYLNAAEHRLQWTSAGHPVPLLHRLDTNEVTPIGSSDTTGLALAIVGEWEYELSELSLPPRSRLLLYSDGLEEAYGVEDGRHLPFGFDGIRSTLQACRNRTLDETLDALFTDSNAITRGEGRIDDTTVMLVERLE
jgi:serine phosphatase RsbU (regulator of sigma subunit)